MKTILVVAALGSLLLCGCSTEARVKTITGGKHVTRYADQPWESFDGLFRDTGDQKVGDHGYKFKLVASMVTSQEQTYDLAMVHAADLTMTSGYSHFVIVSRKVGVLCGGYGAYVSGNTFSGNPTTHADPQVSMEIEMMNEADKGGGRKVFEAEKVMRDLGLKVDRPDSSSEGRARAYLANAHTCMQDGSSNQAFAGQLGKLGAFNFLDRRLEVREGRDLRQTIGSVPTGDFEE